jgi:hypothetical protein
MRPQKHLWVTLSVVLLCLGVRILSYSMSDSGPHAEDYILLGGTLVALGLVTMSFALAQRNRFKAFAEHMGRASRSFRVSRRSAYEPARKRHGSSRRSVT